MAGEGNPCHWQARSCFDSFNRCPAATQTTAALQRWHQGRSHFRSLQLVSGWHGHRCSLVRFLAGSLTLLTACNVSAASLKRDKVSQKPVRAHGNLCKRTERGKKKEKRKKSKQGFLEDRGPSSRMELEGAGGFRPTGTKRGNKVGGNTAPASLVERRKRRPAEQRDPPHAVCTGTA